MKISVIIPNFNDLRIKRAIDSVYAQSYKNFELIVVDGFSTNDTLLDIYKQYNFDKFIYEKDQGIFDALNKGIRAAAGDVVYLMGSDDRLPDSNTFLEIISRFERGDHLDGISIGCEFCNAKGRIIRKWYPNSVSSSKIKRGILPPHFSLFLRKELYEDVGFFKHDEFGNIACDSIWLIDLAIKKPDFNIDVISDKSLIMEYGGSSTRSIKGTFEQFLVIRRYVKKLNLGTSYLLPFIKASSKIFQLRPF